jgi:transcriptional regulator with XRE-family HTH domain
MERDVGKALAERLKELMQVRPDLDTQEKLSKATALSQTTIGRILKNKVSPSLEHVGLLADAFGLTIGQLVVQDTDHLPILNYDRVKFAKVPPELKRKIESYVEYELCSFAALDCGPLDNGRRKRDLDSPPVPEKRTNTRRRIASRPYLPDGSRLGSS